MARNSVSRQAEDQKDDLVKACFIDRDGTINKLVKRNKEFRPPWSVSELQLIPKAHDGIRKLKQLGYMTCIVTNQPDCFDGDLRFDVLQDINNIAKGPADWLVQALIRSSNWYKPNTGMIDYFTTFNKVDKSKSWVIGDTWKDVCLGYNAGIRTIFIGSKFTAPQQYKNVKPDYYCDTLFEASNLIEELDQNGK